MKKYFLPFFATLCTLNIIAQTSKNIKVAIFAPLYIDSAFSGNNYKLGTERLPKYLLPGLEFYNGASMAIDSLTSEGAGVSFYIYDTKGEVKIDDILASEDCHDVSLIIASLNNRNEIKRFADFALQKHIPFVSATYPNDGATIDNPFFVILNSTLKTHCKGIYRYIQRNFSDQNIVFVKKKGQVEDLIAGYFSEMSLSAKQEALHSKTILVDEFFSNDDILRYLDSTKQNVVVCESVSEPFGIRLVKALGGHTEYRSVAIGMPTWDGIKELDKEECSNVPIIYSTPFNYVRTLPLAKEVIRKYQSKMFGRPSDMVFKGFESVYHFSKLILEYRDLEVMKVVALKEHTLFNDFDIAPVKSNSQLAVTDYYENKKLVFIKKKAGVLIE